MNTANETGYELTNNPKIAGKEPSDRTTEENFNIQEKLTKPRNTASVTEGETMTRE